MRPVSCSAIYEGIMESINNFTKGKILGPLLKFAYPVFLALFLQAMYGAIDLLIVGKFASTADVQAWLQAAR